MSVHSASAPTIHRFTRDEYAHMATAGLFDDERVELLDGEVITMSPKLSSHTSALNRLMYAVIAAFGSTALVRVQDPIILNNWSEPEPDIAVCQPDPDYYKHAHPKPDQILLVIEVADSSLAYDRTRKAQAYAGSGIPEYWIVNLPDGQIEILTEPIPGTAHYRQRRLAFAGDAVSLPGGGSLAVSDILPS